MAERDDKTLERLADLGDDFLVIIDKLGGNLPSYFDNNNEEWLRNIRELFKLSSDFRQGTINYVAEGIKQRYIEGHLPAVADEHEQETFGPLSDDPDVNPKKARGAVKAPFHATPELANIQMNNVMAGGGWKYGDFNYHESAVDAQTYLSAMRRHYLLWKDGVDTDDESGQSHLAHIMACCAILIECQAVNKFIDNRAKTGLVKEALNRSSQTFNEFCKKVEQKS